MPFVKVPVDSVPLFPSVSLAKKSHPISQIDQTKSAIERRIIKNSEKICHNNFYNF